MKKRTIFKRAIMSSFICLNLLSASEIESEMGVNIGLLSTKNTEDSKLNNPTLGLHYQNNTYILMPRFDLEYVQLKKMKQTLL